MRIRHNLLYIILLLSFQVMSQTNIDSLFNVAIQYSQEKDYEQASNIAIRLVAEDSNRNDIKIFLANVYAWQQDFDNAKEYIEQVYENNAENNDLYDSWLNVLLWNNEYSKLLEVANIAEQNNYSNNYNLMVKRLLAYTELGEYNKGIDYIENNPGLKDSSQIEYLYNNLVKQKRKNVVSAYGRVDYIPDNTYQYFSFLDYNRTLGKNNLLLRFNYTHRFNTYDYMPEIDYYQFISDRSYMYFNFGYGIRWELLPKQRAGIEYYTSIKNLGLSLGGRFLNYNNKPVYIVTGQIEKYFSRYSLSLRPYYAFQETDNSLSVVSSFRVYGKKAENFSGIQLAYGNSPDENLNNLQQNITLDNYWVRLESNFQLSVSTILNLAFRYTYEETTDNSFRDRYSIELLLKQRF